MDEHIEQVKQLWNEVSDSEWYRSLRTEDRIRKIVEMPESVFHPGVFSLLKKYMPDVRGKNVLLPSSGDNHAVFAFVLMGANVTSADISERQLENAAKIARRLSLPIEFVRTDTRTLETLPDGAFDLVYTSNGTLSWIDDLSRMYGNFHRVLKGGGLVIQYDVHPFTRPFTCEAFKPPKVAKSYFDVLPSLHRKMQDILNAQVNAGLFIKEIGELPSVDASFWYTFRELQEKSPDELRGINDWKVNPLAALPTWLCVVSEKAR